MSAELPGGWEIRQGDCIERMAEMEEASVDAVVCDPPYGIGFMGHDWDQPGDFGPVRANGQPGAFASGNPSEGPHGVGTDVLERAMARSQRRRTQRSPATEAGHRRDREAAAAGAESRTEGGAMLAGRYDLSPSANRRYQAWCEAWARECLRVLKPGGHLLAFCGTRTYHRMAAGIEDAGFEIRDSIMWLYASGFPKSHNLDRLRGEQFCGCEGEATAQHDLRDVPGSDVSAAKGAAGGEGPILLAGVSQPGAPADESPSTASADGSSQSGLERRGDLLAEGGQLPADQVHPGAGVGAADGPQGRVHHGAPAADGDQDRAPADAGGSGPSPGSRSAEQRAEQPGVVADQRLPQDGRGWPDCARCGLPVVPRGLGTALKPAHEPIVVARKPLVGTIAANVLQHGTGGINIAGCKIGTESTERKRTEDDFGLVNDDGWVPTPGTNGSAEGRWPANVVLSEEAAAELDAQTGELSSGKLEPHHADNGKAAGTFGEFAGASGRESYGDRGASRFFYCAKTSRAERNAGLDGFPTSTERRTTTPTSTLAKGRSGGRKLSEREYQPVPASNGHPTVKPINLMRWLVRLVTPPDGTILDPFLGSGTTGCAAVLEGFDFIGIEREPDYIAIAEARIVFWAQHEGREVEEVLGVVGASQRKAKSHEDGGQLGLEIA